MVDILNAPVQTGGNLSTKYEGTATTTETDYKFPSVQDSIVVINYGLDYITAIVNGKSERIGPNGGYYRFVEDSDTVNIKSAPSSSSKFMIEGRSKIDVFTQMDSNAKKNGFVYNAESGLRNWRANLAKVLAVPNTIINVSVIGDSISEGGVAGGGAVSDLTGTKYISNGYVGRIRTALSAKYGNVGGGMIPVFHPKYAPLWTFTGTWVDEALTGGFGITSQTKKTSVSGSTATMAFNGTGISILTARGTGGASFTASIDGGAAIPFDSYIAGSAEGAFEHKITGLTDGAHTLVITSTATGGKTLWLLGAYAIKGTTGVRIHNMARWGTKIIHSVGVSPTYYALNAAVSLFQPKLTIIAMMCNDSAQTPLDEYKRDMQIAINSAKQSGDVLLVSTGAIVATSAPQKDFNKAMLELALENNCAFVDIYSRWGAPLKTNPNEMIGDLIHPTDIGHQDIATAILNVIDAK